MFSRIDHRHQCISALSNKIDGNVAPRTRSYVGNRLLLVLDRNVQSLCLFLPSRKWYVVTWCLAAVRGRVDGRRGEGGQQAASSFAGDGRHAPRTRSLHVRRRSTPRALYRRGRGRHDSTAIPAFSPPKSSPCCSDPFLSVVTVTEGMNTTHA